MVSFPLAIPAIHEVTFNNEICSFYCFQQDTVPSTVAVRKCFSPHVYCLKTSLRLRHQEVTRAYFHYLMGTKITIRWSRWKDGNFLSQGCPFKLWRTWELALQSGNTRHPQRMQIADGWILAIKLWMCTSTRKVFMVQAVTKTLQLEHHKHDKSY
jgi:hypothetical protein